MRLATFTSDLGDRLGIVHDDGIVDLAAHDPDLPRWMPDLLAAGDVVFTGTPAGLRMAMSPPRWLRDGNSVSVHAEGIGGLVNPVRAEALPAEPM
jgi:hypothetical protein